MGSTTREATSATRQRLAALIQTPAGNARVTRGEADAEGCGRTLADVIPSDADLVVTIDGPAGTGKSTVAHALATRLGISVLDTGAMYRAATAIVIDHDLPRGDHDAIVAKVADADLHFDWEADPPAILAWLRPMNDRIREADVTGLVSAISAIGPLRAHMVRKQRIIAKQHPRLVTEGRDQGSLVFPQATMKFFLDADELVRAKRRADQLADRGGTTTVDEVLKRLTERDRLDRERADGPLVCADDAVVVDTTHLSFSEVVDTLERHVRERVLSEQDA